MGAGDAPQGGGTGQIPPAPGAPAPGAQERGARPDGVTILAVLAFLSGILLLGVGAMFVSVGPVLFPAELPVPAVFFAILGGIFVLIGLIYFLTGWGLWTGRSWAWPVALVLAILALFGFPIGTIVGILIIYYLTRPPVKTYFGQ